MRLSEIDLNLLVVLDTVLNEGNVARAARRLHVTPSAISNSLARLRGLLGDALVVRAGRGVVPTPRATALAAPLQQALRDLEHSIAEEAFDPATTTARFTVACTDGGQVVRLPRIARLLAHEMPHAKLRVVGIDSYLSMGGLQGTEADLAIVAVVDKAPGIYTHELDVEESVLVHRRGHPRVSARLTKKQLAALKHVEVQLAPGRGYRELQRTYEQLGITREVAVVVPTFIAAAAVVAQTDLVATLPASLVDELGDRFKLQVASGLVPPVKNVIKLAWHQRTHDDPAMKAFRDLVIRA